MSKKIFALLVILAMVSSMFGTIMAEEPVKIQAIEVNQVLSYAISNTEGTVSLMSNFVAGKNTAIFVKLSQAVTVDRTNNTQFVTVKLNGTEIAKLYPTGEKSTTDLLEFIPKNIQECGEWKAGTYDFAATIPGDTLERTTVKFEEIRHINVLAVPVTANYGGDVRVPGDSWKTANGYLTSVYPVANNGVNWVEGPMLDLSDAKYDVKTDSGCYNVWSALNNLQVRDENGKGKYELIIGFLKDRQGAEGTLQGFTYGKPANIVTESDADMLATVAHEIAHCYNVGDEYSGGTLNPDVNNPPFGMTGKAWNGEGTVTASKEFVKGDSARYGDGSIIPASSRPFEFGGRGLMEDRISYMGSGGKQEYYWTSSAIYDQIFSMLKSVGATASTVAGKAFGGLAKASKAKVIEAKGYITKDGSVTVEPWFAEEYYDEGIEDVKGAYSIDAFDKDGKVLATQGFDISFTAPGTQITRAPFDVLLNFPAETKSFSIKKGSQVIKTVAVSANEPVVSVTSPKAASGVLKGKQTITWQGSDADNDKLTYEVWYNDGNDWTVLGNGLDKTSLDVDFDQLPGSDNGTISVIASDGVNTVEALSEVVKVGFKAPEIVIQEPNDTSKVKQYGSDEEIWFYAEVYDLQDIELDEKNITWTDSTGEVLGNGSELYYGPNEIEAGEYDVTVMATNSKGLKTSKTIAIEVVPATIKVVINGKKLEMDTPPALVNSRTLVPMRAIFEALGLTVGWDANTRTVTGMKGKTNISLIIDSADAKVNNATKKMDVPATLINNRTMVPTRFISESIGAKVEWDGATKTVIITTAK